MTETFLISMITSILGWIIGVFIARWIVRKFIHSAADEPIGSVSGDDVLDFDKADMPYIPVTIVRENGLYYAWFKGNNKFIGQAKKLADIHKMAHEHVMKQLGLRFEFVKEKDKVIA
jgi:hypothetical protein